MVLENFEKSRWFATIHHDTISDDYCHWWAKRAILHPIWRILGISFSVVTTEIYHLRWIRSNQRQKTQTFNLCSNESQHLQLVSPDFFGYNITIYNVVTCCYHLFPRPPGHPKTVSCGSLKSKRPSLFASWRIKKWHPMPYNSEDRTKAWSIDIGKSWFAMMAL